jgi:hypothetical protein
MLQADIGGRAELRHVQGLLAASGKELQKELARNTRTAVAPIKREIPAEALTRMPARYGAVLSRSTKVSTRVTAGATIKATVKVIAMGKREQRDVKSLDAGTLRHTLWGNRHHWYRQRVTPGFVSDPVDWTRKRVIKGAKDAADKVADTIVKG